MSFSKITTTVGLNSKGVPEGCGFGGQTPEGACSQQAAGPVVRERLGGAVRAQGRSLTRRLSAVGTVDVGKARLMFWDLGGQEELQSLWDKVRPAPVPLALASFLPRGLFLRFLARPPTQPSLLEAASPHPHLSSESLF